MDGMITFLNATGKSFVEFSTSMLIQSSVLIIILLVLDVLLRKRVRVTFLYGIWMLALVKLVLPTTLSSPVGLGYWFGDKVPGIVAEKAFSIPSQIASAFQRAEGVGTMMPYGINITDLSAADISPEPLAATSGRLTAAASPATNSLSWQGFIFLGWSTVVIAMVLLLVRRMFFVRGLLAQSKNPNDSMVSIFERCRRQMAVRGPIFLRLCPLAVSPSVCGIFRPTILIPQDLSRKLKAEDLRSILLHELAHVKRGDVWISLIQTILQIAYFYNPLLWLANGIIRKVREQAVDEMVLVALGEQAEDYPQTLLNISRMTFGRPTFDVRLTGVMESKKALERRIMTMLSRPTPKSSKLGYVGLIAVVAIGAILLPMGRNAVAGTASTQEDSRGNAETKTIVPGLRVGDYTLDMSKDEVLRKLGEPESIQLGEDEIVRRGQEKYTLNNLPREYIMAFGDVSFFIHEDSAQGIFVRSPLYKLSNGLGVGDSEQKIKQAFGEDFQLEKVLGKDLLCYHAKGLGFQIHKKNRTVAEIVVYQPQGERDAPDQTEHPKHAIVPGVRVGDYTLDMSKDEVLRKLGEPESIQLGEDEIVRRGQEKYNLNNLPRKYIMAFGDVSFFIHDDSAEAIFVRSPLYKLSNGLKVGDSEQKIKQAFGEDFQLKEDEGKEYLLRDAKGLGFQIHKKNRTVAEIVVYQPQGDRDAQDQQEHSQQTIIPGVGVGDYTLGMSKDEILRKLGEPQNIHYSGEKYTLNNLPEEYYMSFGDISFAIKDDIVIGIGLHSTLYKFDNGLGLGDSEEKIKQAFGNDFQLGEYGWKNQLNYEDKGLQFEIRNKDKTVIGIDVYQAEGNQQSDQRSVKNLSAIVRKAAADGRISFKLTTPDEFKAIAGRPTREWTEGDDDDDEVIYMEYPGIEVKFVGLDNSPPTVVYVLCQRVGIDIGQDRSIDERDLDQQSKHIIVPGLRVGDYTLDMSKDDVLKKLGEPEAIQPGFDDVDVVRRGQEMYSLNNLPNHYILCFRDISFWFEDDSGRVMISVHSPLYKLSNGLGVGDSEQKIKQAFGEDFQLEKVLGKDFLCYHAKGLGFEIHKKNKTVAEIVVYQPQGDRSDREDRQGHDVERRRDSRTVQRETPKVSMLSDQPLSPITFPKIDRKPKPFRWGRSEIKSLPKYDPDLRNGFQVDLRCRDLSKLDLRNSIENLMYADFDDSTVWPASDKMPNGFTWQRFMELGKNPGLGVRALHERGIRGKGVGVAIIDQSLLTEHIEYADSLRLYEENNIRDGTHSSMHGAAVASIAIGKTVGVAPDADLYYVATWDLTRDDNPRYNFVFRAQAIRRLLEINRQLPANRKIRVISNSIGWSPSQEGYDEITAACEEAKAAGIFVISCGIIEPYGFDFGGLGRHPLANPDSFESYGPCLDWAKIFYNSAPGRDSDTLWVPEDSRATASFTGGDEYVFYRQGGASWCAPYIAGIYALAAQADPDITPKRFWNLALKTGRTIELEHKGEGRSFGPIIDPVALISTLQRK